MTVSQLKLVLVLIRIVIWKLLLASAMVRLLIRMTKATKAALQLERSGESAGTGIFHSEYNLEDEETNSQIWIMPKEKGVTPSWDTAEFPKSPANDALLLVSGDGNAPHKFTKMPEFMPEH